MSGTFDIIRYMSGLTGFVFDKTVLERVALERGVAEVESYNDMDVRTRDLLKADLYFTAYTSPTVWGSYSHAHGSFSETNGAQTLSSKDKETLYNLFMSIYRKYDDPKLEEATDDGTLQWLED